VAYWDYGAEGMMLMEFFAKTLHPDLFQDLNMTGEVKEYYSTFYHYNLTDEEASRILKHLPPAS
jgi:iron complex transport system substrate-binding protein